jgi:hypothetical protein
VVKGRAVLVCILSVSAFTLRAQEAAETAKPDFQRTALKREESGLILEGAFNYWAVQSGENALHNMRFRGGVEYTFKTRHTLSLSLPYDVSLYDNPEARQTVFYSPGDLNIGYEYLHQRGNLNLFFGPLLTIPLAASNEYAAREGVLQGSGGRYYAGAFFSITGTRDPVVWNAGIIYQAGLPKEERFSTSWEPGNMQIAAGFSDLVNDRYGFSLGFSHNVNLPKVIDGRWDKTGPMVSTHSKVEGFILFEHDYVRVSLEAALYPLNQPFVIGVVYGHEFKFTARQISPAESAGHS